jgi:2-oxoglutarate dehydrogenase E1 component
MRPGTSPLSAMDAGWIEALRERYRDRPEAVDVGWRVLFQVLDELDAGPHGMDAEALLRQAIRAHGHLLAATDPLAPEPVPPAPAAFAAHVQPAGLPAAALARRYGGTLTIEAAHIDCPDCRAWLQSAFEALTDEPSEAIRETLRGVATP